MVPFGISPTVMFVWFPFAGDREHGVRNWSYLGRYPRTKVSHLGGL